MPEHKSAVLSISFLAASLKSEVKSKESSLCLFSRVGTANMPTKLHECSINYLPLKFDNKNLGLRFDYG